MTIFTRAALRAAVAAAAIAGLVACAEDNGTATDEAAPAPGPAPSVTTTTLEDGTEFIIRVISSGDGDMIAAGQVASVHYTGWLYDPEAADERGTKFDSSVDRGAPFQFPLGQGRVIRGWDVGVNGMQIGEQRELIIPALWAYGDRGAGGLIPPGATLLFEVELLGIN